MKFNQNVTRIAGTLREDLYLAEFFLELKVFHTKVVEKIKTHILYCIFFPENHAVYEIIWETIGGPNVLLVTIWRSAETARFAKARIRTHVHDI